MQHQSQHNLNGYHQRRSETRETRTLAMHAHVSMWTYVPGTVRSPESASQHSCRATASRTVLAPHEVFSSTEAVEPGSQAVICFNNGTHAQTRRHIETAGPTLQPPPHTPHAKLLT